MFSLTQCAALVFAACATASARPAKASASACAEIRQRVPWTSLNASEKSSYIQADLCLMNSPSKSGIPGAVSRWDDLQWPHVVQTTTIHNVGAFLPFHRYYMTVHERLIRDECGYTGRMPYWNELADIDDPSSCILWKKDSFGGNGAGDAFCVSDGPFANLTLRWLEDGSVAEHCLTRIFNDAYLPETNQKRIDMCNEVANYSSAWDCWAADPHNGGHQFVGGIMSDNTLSPGDPVFYLHHSWLDKLWWDWQKLDLPNRLTDMGGPNIPFGLNVPSPPLGVPANPSCTLGGAGPEFTDYFGDNGNITTLNHRIYMAGIYPNITIADVMDLNGPAICSEYIDP